MRLGLSTSVARAWPEVTSPSLAACDPSAATGASFTANDGQADSNVATIALTDNAAPVATDSASAGAEDTVITGQAVAADVDSPSLAYTLVSGPQHGVLTFNPDGSYSYAPGADFNGADSFTFTASDGVLQSNIATVALTVSPVNDAPVAANGSSSGPEDLVITGQVAASDVDSANLTYAVVTGPQHGVLTFGADGAFSYAPNANYNGPDSFTFKANDGSLNSNAATISLAIGSVNDAPVASDGSAAGLEDTNISGQAVASDVDSPSLSYAVVTGPQHGVLTFNPNGSYSYAPGPDYNGADSFTFKANDGSLDSNAATVSLTVHIRSRRLAGDRAVFRAGG